MKYSKWILGLIASLMMMTSLVANAAAYHPVQGRGFAVGSCTGGYGWRSCVSNIEWRAENDARYDAENDCRFMRGRLQSPFPSSCWDRCNPMFEPPQGQFSSVSCNVDCNFTCMVE